MALVLKTPGVYIEEVPKFPPSVAQVETAIPAFIGYTEKAKDLKDDDLHLVPKRIVSLLEYETYFGKGPNETLSIVVDDYMTGAVLSKRVITADVPVLTKSKHTMYYQMQLYFANGGGPCYIVSVNKTTVVTPLVTDMLLGLDAACQYDEPTLLVFPQAVQLSASDMYDVYDAALAKCEILKDRFTIMDCDDNAAAATLRGATGIGANNLKYGAAYHPFLNTSINYLYDLSSTSVTVNVHVNEDADVTDVGESSTPVVYNLLTSIQLQQQIKLEVEKLRVTLPPCTAVSGIYAYVDSTRGVWKAPANVSLSLVNSLTKNINDADQGDLNIDATGGKSINVIRAFTGRGILVWGARTLAGNDNEWRYVPVRRFFNMVEESVKKATTPFVFEPNDANTWTRVNAMISNYLTILWRQGALAGAKPEHAFYVACGLNTTMSALDILEGRMIIEIGMAAVRPAEFIILRFSHKMQES